MAEMQRYEPGTPSWIDIGSTDLDATHAFYTGLFGWTPEAAGPPEETGGYGFYTLRGKQVAGYGPAMAGGVWWTTYVTVADVDVTAKEVEAAGGSIIAPPMDVMQAGRMAVCVDSTGAAFSIWQPGEMIGAQLVNEPGSLCWNELATRDPEAATTFYGAVFGWGAHTSDGPMPYVEWQRGGEGGTTVGGMMPMGADFPAEVPNHWLVYFAVEDADAAAARITELGGNLMAGPMDVPPGRMAVATGPHGEAFAVIALSANM